MREVTGRYEYFCEKNNVNLAPGIAISLVIGLAAWVFRQVSARNCRTYFCNIARNAYCFSMEKEGRCSIRY